MRDRFVPYSTILAPRKKLPVLTPVVTCQEGKLKTVRSLLLLKGFSTT